MLRPGVRNAGDRTVPNLLVSFTIKGQRGEDSSLPFGVSDPQPELAQPDRPVWVLAADLSAARRLLRSGRSTTSSPKTFALGPLKPGKTTTAIWKLSAVRAGKYTLVYSVGAGLGAPPRRKPTTASPPAARSRPR